MKEDLKVFYKAILAGVYIALAASVYLYVINAYGTKIIASFLFSIGLLVVCAKGYYLYTGKVGYMLPYKKENVNMISYTILGNFIGIFIVSILINLLGNNEIYNQAVLTVSNKFSNVWYKSLISSIFCGVLMYTAVDGYGKIKDSFSKNIIVVLSVMVFLILGFDHSIANIAYLIFSKSVNFKQILLLLLMVLGNGLGAVSINLLHTLINKE